ncbi:hypothetical protein [Pseudovibrio ascidiaceicola]|uniref:hypothetical protein n=1 Tax=Pseudovibrio ascidiaceicola TaxID=285279 RepID=UPI000D69AA88|nr:hypothetical protein [Pseudovibrio ascidiaceicola]
MTAYVIWRHKNKTAGNCKAERGRKPRWYLRKTQICAEPAKLLQINEALKNSSFKGKFFTSLKAAPKLSGRKGGVATLANLMLRLDVINLWKLQPT